MKTKVPDGKGGWVEVEGERIPGQKAQSDKQASALQAQAEEEAVGLVEHLHRAGALYGQEHNLTVDQTAFAICLTALNAREFFPGGVEKFDAINARALEYFEANLPPNKR